jgi:putative alpha-1,2-mannosidase
MGHTYPGATVPFGMVQLSPRHRHPELCAGRQVQPRLCTSYCAGYQYDDPTIVGFSHTHFSGTGHSDLGDFLMMPTTGPLQLNPGTAEPAAGRLPLGLLPPERSGRARLLQSPKLADHDITAELTATTRVGFHQYTFPQAEQAHVILDLMAGIYNYPDKNVWSFVRVENDSVVTGYRQTNGWGRSRTLYFALQFSKPFKSYTAARKYDTKAALPRLLGALRPDPQLARAGRRASCGCTSTSVPAPARSCRLKFALSLREHRRRPGQPARRAAGLGLRANQAGQSQQLWQQELSKVSIQTP